MRRLAAYAAMTALFFAVGTVRAFEYPNDLSRWTVTKPPDKWGDARQGDVPFWAVVNDADHAWVVYLREGRPSARLRSVKDPFPPPLPFTIKAEPGLRGDRGNIKVDDGWIVSFNAGEWGGWLWWFSPDGGRRYQIAKNASVNGFFPTDAGLLAVEGISHGRTRGNILRIARGDEGVWRSTTFLPLGEEAITAATDADGSLVVATYSRLIRVRPAAKAFDVLLENAFWADLYPTSMVVSEGTVFVGMRHGVARVRKRGNAYRVDWLLPAPEFDRMVPTREGFR